MAKKRASPSKKSLANLKPFKPGDPRINRNGRPKIMPLQKALMAAILGHTNEEDLTKSEIAEVVKNMLSIAKDKRAYQSTAAVNAGKEILDRAFGKVKTMEEDEIEAKEIVWNETKTYAKAPAKTKKKK